MTLLQLNCYLIVIYSEVSSIVAMQEFMPFTFVVEYVLAMLSAPMLLSLTTDQRIHKKVEPLSPKSLDM